MVDTNNEPISYAHVAFEGLPMGTSTNLNGEFELKFPNIDTDVHPIKISCIGYVSIVLSKKNLSLNEKILIQLDKASLELDGVVVGADRLRKKDKNFAKRIVSKALARVSKNYQTHPHLLNTFYRHYCSEDSIYVRLIEAAIDIYDPEGFGSISQLPEHRLSFKVKQLRRSFDFTQSTRLSHPPVSLNYLILNDLLSFSYGNKLRKDFDRLSFYISDTTIFDGKTLLNIAFENQSSDHRYEGNLFINQQSYAIHKISVHEGKKNISGLDSTLQTTNRQIIYREFQDRLFLDRIVTDMEAVSNQYDSLARRTDGWSHTSHIELMVNNILLEGIEPFSGGEPNARHLRGVEFDPLFWDSYTILQSTPTEEQIIRDLSKNLSLKKQFQTFNTLDRGGISITQSEQFKSVVEGLRGRPSYLIAWAKWGYPNFFDLNPSNYFKRMLRRKKVNLVFLSLEQSEDDWKFYINTYGLNITRSQHYQLDLNLDSPTLRKFFNDSLPYQLILDQSGEIVDDNPPMLYDSQLKALLKPLVKKIKK